MPPKKPRRFPVPKTAGGKRALLLAGIAAFEVLSRDIEKDAETTSVPVVTAAVEKKPAVSAKKSMKQKEKPKKTMK